MTIRVEIGTRAPNVIETGSGVDIVLGLKGDDIINLHGGFDIVDGGKGNDIAYFDGAYSSFKISKPLLGVTTVTGAGQTALLTDVERFGFTNGIYDVGSKSFTANTVAVSGGGTVNEGGDLVFTFTRTGDISRAYDATFSVSGNLSAADFGLSSFPGTVTFAAGQSTATLTLRSVADGTYEGTENLSLQLTGDGSRYAVAGSGQAAGSVVDPAPVTRVGILPTAGPVPEAGGVITLNFAREGDLSGPLTVFFSNGPTGQPNVGTATAADFVGGIPSSVTFAAGAANASVSLQVFNDTLVEDFEGIRFAIQPNASYVIGGIPGASGATASGIQDNDQPPPPPVVNVTAGGQPQVTVGEGASITFTFTRTGDLSQALTVGYNFNTPPTAGATPGSDFTLPPGFPNVQFLAGEATKTLTLQTINDSLSEGPGEFFTFGLTPSSAYQNGPNFAVQVTIQDNDAPPPPATVTLSALDPIGTETPDGNDFLYMVSRAGDLSQPLTVFYTVVPSPVNGAVAGGVDLNTSAGQQSITIPAGQASAQITFDAVDDALVEGPETFLVRLDPGPNYSLPPAFSVGGTVMDNDAVTPPPNAVVTVSTTTPEVPEADGADILFVFERTGDMSQELTVNYSLAFFPAGGAQYGIDYTVAPSYSGAPIQEGAQFTNQITIAAGASSAVLEFDVIDDGTPEGSLAIDTRGEVVQVNLGPGDYDRAEPFPIAQALIVDNDSFLV